MKSRKSHGDTLIEADEQWARGRGETAVDEASLSASTSVLMNFLRSYRGRNDLASVILPRQSREASDLLETIRTLIFSGELQKAEALASRIDITSWEPADRNELLVERARIAVFQDRAQLALELAREALAQPMLSPLSRMTCHQLSGQAMIASRNFSEAEMELQSAVALAELYPEAQSAVAARAFLVQLYSEQGNRVFATRALQGLYAHLESLENPELWLSRLFLGIRGEVHFFRNFDEPLSQRRALEEAIEIGRYLGYGAPTRKSQAELQRLLAQADTLLHPRSVYSFNGFSFLPFRNLILRETPKTVSRIDKYPVIKKVLLELCKKPRSSEELFERVWKLKFSPAKHALLLRVTLSNLRKFLPKGALVVNDGVISLQ